MGKIQQQYIINEKGQKTAVVLPFEEYEELLEDMHDLVIIAERRDEPAISFDELKKRLKKMDYYKVLWKKSSEKDLRNIEPDYHISHRREIYCK